MDISRKAILEPRSLWWEAGGIFNPAVVELNKRIYLLYRAVGRDHISRFGLAISENGEDFQRFDSPIYEAAENDGWARLGLEDPRAVTIGRDIYITCTAASVYPATSVKSPEKTPWRIRPYLLKTRDMQNFQSLGSLINGVDTKDAVLFPRAIGGYYYLLHRIVPDIFISQSKDIRYFEGGFRLMSPTNNKWENEKIGAAIPPIETDKGWLVLYHGVSKTKTYSVGAALLDLNDPRLVLNRLSEAIIVPETSWEKRGEVGNVVFPTGSLVRADELWLYYGAADSRVGLMKLSLGQIKERLINYR